MSQFTQVYYINTKNLKPSPLLVEALESLKTEGKDALDLGCGAGRDTRLLLERNFNVTAIDSEPLTKKFMDDLQQLGKLTYKQSTFENFPYERYDLINARYSLPFNPPESSRLVIDKILRSLKSGGIFVGQLFGINDEWNVPDSNMTFHTKQQVLNLFSQLEIIKFEEKDEEGGLANGSMKHWHIYDVIVRQK